MTDNEVIKALECCSKPYCNNNKCPLHQNTINTKDCITQLSTNALDLINRYEAEIERLETTLKEAFAEIEELKRINLHCKSEAVEKLANRLKAKALSTTRGGRLGVIDCFDIEELKKEVVGES